MTATATTTDIAAAIGTTPRELRKFLRSEARNVGKGSRYALPAGKRDITAMAKRFAAWTEAKAAKTDDTPTNDNGVELTDETAAENEELEPTDEELAEIDA